VDSHDNLTPNQIVLHTWLSYKPSPNAILIVALSYACLELGALAYWHDWHHAAQWMMATPRQVFERHEYWRLWTTLWVHADLGHLLSNSFLFMILGYFLSGYFGLWAFPIAAFGFGGVINAISLTTYAPDTGLLGASGMVAWMGGAWLSLYVALNRQLTLAQRLLRALGVAILLFAPSEAFDPQISYRTHLFGFVLGWLWGWGFFFRYRRQFREAEVSEWRVD
jgi:rhomboid protease GluP